MFKHVFSDDILCKINLEKANVCFERCAVNETKHWQLNKFNSPCISFEVFFKFGYSNYQISQTVQ